MRTLTKLAATIGVVGAIAAGSVAPAAAFHVWIGHHHRYYNYYGGCVQSGTCCPSGYTVQGGVCRPYRFTPQDRGYYWYR
jgi:hypothetical protein